MRKNPIMSFWLSGAHAAAGKVLGPARGVITAAALQRQKAMMRDAEKMAAAFWGSALKPLAPPKRRSRKL
ncbi:hypothetical protein M2323_000853 [Rhodoblastus acidophilus]|uniref:hypothetical protein n=1 Tax=Rhodoblastus acidophilus TaxID=1074 RepID=UPI0022258D6C|nr:hypothetical protein [Rhodoblastus acidophilus]MCW2283000.1 hypothetical protein [Rhodoblastus acidophilus]MCW2331949.1 hypothetical protein [Rhodoblastus acidophilus]